ncbi:hypothetical protein [Neisseria chenwenguii]|uniref:Uncharacterized protein n=1 Tax=Neisseria chenwenguii TaxID=1853278 RepID=A0A220S370_9NEIS|nr:hypothetical protein [Neisseria chenwenguii]ASK27941.1 hypothetical protein BG910_09545 [Neisseria chenwenguii]ROV54483.1 hypothetical protein EGS38_10965 [Neisseria chenwenguii]
MARCLCIGLGAITGFAVTGAVTAGRTAIGGVMTGRATTTAAKAGVVIAAKSKAGNTFFISISFFGLKIAG